MILPWFNLNLEPTGPVSPNGSTHYHIYANAGDGGPIDYSAPVATVDGLEWMPPPLTLSGQWRFGVRAFGSTSGLEESNVDAAVLIILDDQGKDITNRPAAPFGLRLRAEAGGRIVAEWTHPGGTRENAPSGFHVYIGRPTPDYSTPAATVSAKSAQGPFSAVIDDLADGTWAVGVRAFNETAEESNGNFIVVAVDGRPPDPVDGLSGEATAEGG